MDDAILFAQALKERGCDIIEILAGQTTLTVNQLTGAVF